MGNVGFQMAPPATDDLGLVVWSKNTRKKPRRGYDSCGFVVI